MALFTGVSQKTCLQVKYMRLVLMPDVYASLSSFSGSCCVSRSPFRAHLPTIVVEQQTCPLPTPAITSPLTEYSVEPLDTLDRLKTSLHH